MKNIISILAIGSVVLFGLSSCNKAERESVNGKAVSFQASLDTRSETKTALSLKFVPNWANTQNGMIHLFETLGSGNPAAGTGVAMSVDAGNPEIAHFQAAFGEQQGSGDYTYTAVIAPVDADGNYYVPKEQHPMTVATDEGKSYFDPDADFLVAQSAAFSGSQSGQNVDLFFNRPVCVSRLALMGMGEAVSVEKVIITAQDALTGSVVYDDINFDGGFSFSTSGSYASNTITLLYGSGNPLSMPAEGIAYAYFFCLPGTHTITSITVESGSTSYTKTIGKEMTFSLDEFKQIAVDMRNASETPIVPVPTINKGNTYYHAFTSKVFENSDTEVLSWKTWTLSGNIKKISGVVAKGLQFGTADTPYKSLSLTSNFGEDYGVEEVIVNTSGASGIEATLSVSVGGTHLLCGTSETVSISATATDYIFAVPANALKAGDIVIAYSQTSSKAIYIKSITINPGLPAQLEMSDITCTGQTSNSLTFSWDPVTGAEGYQVSLDGGVNYGETQAATSYSWTGLDASTEYTLYVKAIGNGISFTTSAAKTASGTTDAAVTGTTVTYTVASKTSVTTTGTAPEGSSATYSQTYSTTSQMTSGNSITLTLTGFTGKKIVGASVSVRSNASGGAGSLSLTAGSSTIASIADSAFNTANWNGSYTNSYVKKDLTVTETTVGESESIVLTIAATTNSLFFESLTLTYN